MDDLLVHAQVKELIPKKMPAMAELIEDSQLLEELIPKNKMTARWLIDDEFASAPQVQKRMIDKGQGISEKEKAISDKNSKGVKRVLDDEPLFLPGTPRAASAAWPG